MQLDRLAPKHPERICWGCDHLCPADDLACGNGTIRTPHPVELFGEDWLTCIVDRDVDQRRAPGDADTPEEATRIRASTTTEP